MNRIKAMIYLLVFLLALQPALQGCTVIDYQIGKALDIQTASRYDAKAVEDIQKKDVVDIIFKDKSFVRGRIKSIEVNKNVRIEVILDRVENDNFKQYETFGWDEIEEIKVVKVRKGFRNAGLTLGIFFDLGFAFLLIYGAAMKGAAQGMGN